LTRVLGLADGIQLLLKRECVERTERQVDEMEMRLLSIRNASAKARRISASLPVAAAGSGMPQCAVIG
jgi:hypothetical protein